VWEPLLNRSTSGTLQNPNIFGFDSKAMRRVEEGFGIAVMAENLHATQGMVVQCGFSLLTSLS